MKKVYCSECKYYHEYTTKDGMNIVWKEQCEHPNGSDSWYQHIDYAQPNIKNKNNNCKDFEEKI